MASAPSVAPGTLVVILEDDEDTLELYSLALTAAGYDVRQTRTGEEGLTLVRSLRPRAVISDLTLPDHAGVPLCDALRAAGAATDAALIVVSGSADQGLLAAARQAGAREILIKPCLPTDLEAALRRALRASSVR